jgi:glucosamine--fructose-6-phosphate aminotransferase (isomerizing)
MGVIVGYVGDNRSLEVLLGGLKRLEYRGYDSAGVAVIDPEGRIDSRKKSGKLQMLVDELESNPMANGATGIGHTRWATHGGPTDRNAHRVWPMPVAPFGIGLVSRSSTSICSLPLRLRELR